MLLGSTEQSKKLLFKNKKFKRTLSEYHFRLSSEGFKNTAFGRWDGINWDASTAEWDALLPPSRTTTCRHPRKLEHSGNLDMKSLWKQSNNSFRINTLSHPQTALTNSEAILLLTGSIPFLQHCSEEVQACTLRFVTPACKNPLVQCNQFLFSGCYGFWPCYTERRHVLQQPECPSFMWTWTGARKSFLLTS